MTTTRWIAAAVVLVLLALGIGYFASSRLHVIGGALWPSLWAIVIAVVVIAVLAKAAGSWLDFLNYFLFALCGGALGWVTGILASPATADEQRVFGEYKTAIVGFVSGFAVTKINDIWRIVTTGTPPLLFSPPVLNRLLLFAGMFLLLVAQQYNLRQSSAGQVIVSASVQPPSALVDQTASTISVRPGAKITLKGAAVAYQDIDVDWSVKHDGSAFAEAVTLDRNVLAIPNSGDAKLTGVKSGDTLSLIATSQWNRSKTATLQVILIVDGQQPVATPAEVPKPDTTRTTPEAK